MSTKAKGVWAASLVPLNSDGSINLPGLSRHASWLLNNGCDGIALFGTTGEAPSFTLDEREEALEYLLAHDIAAEQIIVGTGCCATDDTVRLTRHAVQLGCAGVLVIPPYYFKAVTTEGLYASYASVIDNVAEDNLRLYLYHFPDMSGVSISFDLVQRLLKTYPQQIAGIKDSSGDLNNMLNLIREFKGLDVFAGDDDLLWPVVKAGGVGSITSTANIFPHLLADIYRSLSDGAEPSRETQQVIEAVWKDLILKFPVTEALKECLAEQTGQAAWLRMRPPLTRLTEQQRNEFNQGFLATGFTILDSQRETMKD